MRAPGVAEPLRKDRASVFTYLGMEADPWQKELVEATEPRIIVCCHRGAGKSRTIAAKAIVTAILDGPAKILIISGSQRQSAEVLLYVKQFHRALLGERLKIRKWSTTTWRTAQQEEEAERQAALLPTATTDASLHHRLSNGSEVVCLPGKSDKTIVGFHELNLLILDEGARIPDEVYHAVTPMLGISRSYGEGQLIALSTPKGKAGWFWEVWRQQEEFRKNGQPTSWRQFFRTADQCPRLTKEFLEEERQGGAHWYAENYLCEFRDVVDAVFSSAEIEGMQDADAPFMDLDAILGRTDLPV
jgi:hypothetical protein